MHKCGPLVLCNQCHDGTLPYPSAVVLVPLQTAQETFFAACASGNLNVAKFVLATYRVNPCAIVEIGFGNTVSPETALMTVPLLSALSE